MPENQASNASIYDFSGLQTDPLDQVSPSLIWGQISSASTQPLNHTATNRPCATMLSDVLRHPHWFGSRTRASLGPCWRSSVEVVRRSGDDSSLVKSLLTHFESFCTPCGALGFPLTQRRITHRHQQTTMQSMGVLIAM